MRSQNLNCSFTAHTWQETRFLSTDQPSTSASSFPFEPHIAGRTNGEELRSFELPQRLQTNICKLALPHHFQYSQAEVVQHVIRKQRIHLRNIPTLLEAIMFQTCFLCYKDNSRSTSLSRSLYCLGPLALPSSPLLLLPSSPFFLAVLISDKDLLLQHSRFRIPFTVFGHWIQSARIATLRFTSRHVLSLQNIT